MKKLIVLVLALALGGCATELAKFKEVYSLATTTTVPPSVLIAAANSFDIAEGTATNYLVYCKAHRAEAACGADNLRAVIKYTRTGRAARNQAETYISTNTNAPSAIYTTIVAAVNQLNSTPKGTAQ